MGEGEGHYVRQYLHQGRQQAGLNAEGQHPKSLKANVVYVVDSDACSV